MGNRTSASTVERDFGRHLKARTLSVVGVVHQLTGSAGGTSVVTAPEAGRKVIAEPS